LKYDAASAASGDDANVIVGARSVHGAGGTGRRARFVSSRSSVTPYHSVHGLTNQN